MYKDDEKKKEYMKEYYIRNKKLLKEKHKEYYQENKDYLIEKQKEYISDNKVNISEYMKDYYEKNKDKKSIYDKEYYIINKDKIYIKQKEYVDFMLVNDILYKLKWNIRTLIKHSFNTNGKRKETKTENILGISFEDFRTYLESNFETWMTWENRGLYNGELNYGWDLDHIIPISSAKNEEDIIKLNHYTNLQPLCSKINRDIKRNRLDYKK